MPGPVGRCTLKSSKRSGSVTILARQDLRAEVLAAPLQLAEGGEDLQVRRRADRTLQQAAAVEFDAGRLRHRRHLAHADEPGVLHQLERHRVRGGRMAPRPACRDGRRRIRPRAAAACRAGRAAAPSRRRSRPARAARRGERPSRPAAAGSGSRPSRPRPDWRPRSARPVPPARGRGGACGPCRPRAPARRS